MAEQQITNPLGYLTKVSDFTTGLDAEGQEIPYGTTVRHYRANVAIAKGEVVTFTVATTTVPLSLVLATAGSSIKFVALEAAAVGEQCAVAVAGHAAVLCTTTAVVFGDALIVSATAGSAAAVAEDATTVVGTVLGFAAGAKGAGVGTVLVYVHNH